MQLQLPQMLLLLLVCQLFPLVAAPPPPHSGAGGGGVVVVELAGGARVEGLSTSGGGGDNGGSVQSFKGIPYAEPPLGPLRFAAAVPARPWNGTRSAHHFGSACIQGPDPQPDFHSEDCLFANVWRPAPPKHTGGDGARVPSLPVMAFVHGGAFRQGTTSDPLYDGTALARHGVIVVSFQYRLGALGFLGVRGSDAGTGKMNGINDMVVALQWVQRNIGFFGGAPGNVTVFSESAGAIATCVLCFSPRSNGLFRRAILESVRQTPLCGGAVLALRQRPGSFGTAAAAPH
jgi:para-nitrobenzyl esterase